MMRGGLLLAAVVLLGGCLEVDQHPPWLDGAYAGKTDQRSPASRFDGDRQAWTAAVTDRTHLQDEYRRTRH